MCLGKSCRGGFQPPSSGGRLKAAATPFVGLLIAALFGHSVFATDTQPLSVYPLEMTLNGPEGYQQLAVTAQAPGADPADASRSVHYRTDPPGIVKVDAAGFVKPVKDGAATIHVEASGGARAAVKVEVKNVGRFPRISYPNEIVPLFTKYGCNGGGCHGKSGGQNGFRLSLFGFEPAEDHEYLVKEGRGRRIFPGAPEHSLLVMKASGEIPHGGGERVRMDSHAVRMMTQWIRQGMPYAEKDDPEVSHIEVFPKERIVKPGSQQQLVVTAHYTDGSIKDVTRVAVYESNEKDMAEADHDGLVTFNHDTGSVAVMVRFQEKVNVFQAIIPLGAPVEDVPEPKNFIDELVFQKLKMLGLPPSGESRDLTFLRRVTIDIAGRLPTVEEMHAFKAENTPDKRDRLIERLLDSSDYADYFANKWSAILRNKRNSEADARSTYAFHDWIRVSLRTNKPYDAFMKEIVSARGEVGRHPPVTWYRQVKTPKAQLQDIAQVFLGVRIQCAECHHHPFEKWSQNDYYGFLAFFSRVSRKKGNQPKEEIIFHRRGVAAAQNPKTKQSLKPTVLEGVPMEIAPEEDPAILRKK
ncbi:MAG: DUF1549 domain-containing protein [Verrucomicrobiota bacterium]